jgi:uncharacterized protein (TIGR03067 family)
MKFLHLIAFAAGATGVSQFYPAGADDKDGKGNAKLDGGYTLVSGERDGKAIPEDRVKGSIVKFTGDKIVGTDKDKKEFFVSTYTLDTSSTPWKIKMKSTTPKDGEAAGVIKKEGDTITIAYNLPGGTPPTDFKTKEKQHLFVLKNMNK